MSDGATAVVWLSEADARRDEAARALAEWARARGVLLTAPISEPRSGAVDGADGNDSAAVEKELAHAHEAIAGADTDAAERALARAEAQLREHPELPNAAWLRAEVQRAWSSRFVRLEPKDEARGRAAWQEAEALDGGRVAGIGEPHGVSTPQSFALRISAPANVTVRVDGLPPAAQVMEGEHAVVALAGDRVVYASWVAVRRATELTIPVGENACSSEALSSARREGDRVVATGVSCPTWLAVVSGERPGSILVARCDHDACAPLVEWRAAHALALGPPQSHDRASSSWPGWAKWTVAGIGAATVLSVVLVASGVFESRAVENRFVVGGARQE